MFRLAHKMSHKTMSVVQMTPKIRSESVLSKPVKRVPLHEATLQSIRTWLEPQQSGTRIPSVRVLAPQLEVSRLTLTKALNKLLASGELERRGRKTFVGARGRSTAEPVHPFLAGGVYCPRPTTTVNVVVFEHLPHQTKCWTRLQDEFNVQHGSIRIEVCHLPSTVRDAASYVDYIRQGHVDIVQFPHALMGSLRDAGMLAEIPPTLAAEIQGEACLWRSLLPQRGPDGFRHGVPLHAAFHLLAWNPTLVTCVEQSAGVVDAETVMRWFRDTEKTIPPGAAVVPEPGAVLSAAGCDMSAWTRGDVDAYLKRLADLTATLLQADSGRYLDSHGDWREDLPGFYAGRTAFLFGLSYWMLDALKAAPNPWRAVLVSPQGACHPSIGVTLAGVVPSSRQADEGMEFLRFLISRKAQEIMVEGGLNAPMRRDCQGVLAANLGIPEPVLATALDRLRLSANMQTEAWNWFVNAVAIPGVARSLRMQERLTAAAIFDRLKQELLTQVPMFRREPASPEASLL